ncbi:hypothetical protein [Nocardia sp. NPDC049707]|uniref:hypothetical protein n=1 Tax=Nocardia sp. NPDC049707 TaxID=3154735 RepID=UPI0034307529
MATQAPLTMPVAPVDYLVDGVIAFLASLSAKDFAALVAQARPPADPQHPGNRTTGGR